MMEDDLKKGLREYVILEEFFREIRKEFGRKNKGKCKKIKEEIGKKIEEDMWKGMDVF